MRFLQGSSVQAKSDYEELLKALEATCAGTYEQREIPIRLAFVEDPERNDYVTPIRYMTRKPNQAHRRCTGIDLVIEGLENYNASEGFDLDTLEDAYKVRLHETLEVIQRFAHRPHPVTNDEDRKSLPMNPAHFRISEMEAVGTYGLHTNDTFLAETMLAAHGVKQRNLRLDFASLFDGNAAIYTPRLPAILNSYEAEDPSAPPMMATTTVSVSQFMSPQGYDSIFSAILFSRSIRTLRVGTLDFFNLPGLDRRLRDRLWQWIAVVLGGHLASSLEQVQLWASELMPDDISMLEKAIARPDPLTALFPSTSQRRMRTIRATVTASQFYLLPSQADDGSVDRDALETLTFSTPIANLHMLEAEDYWLSVFLPGWGKAWVKRSHATITQTTSPTRTKKATGIQLPVRHWRIDGVSERQRGNVLELLRLTGARLTILSLNTFETPGGPPRDHWIRDVFQACPDMEAFSAKNLPLASLESVADLFDERACLVKELVIEVAPTSGIAYADCFLDYLADDAHPFAKQMHTLELTLTPKPSDPIMSVLTAALDVLEFNHVLSSLKLAFRAGPGQFTPDELVLVHELRRHNGELVAVRLAPLPLPNKIAFLSAIKGHTTRSLSHDSAKLIFQYAARCQSRRVQIEAVPVPLQPAGVAQMGAVDSWTDIDDMACPSCGGPMHEVEWH